MPSGRPQVVVKMHIFVSCQIDVMNKQLFSQLSWNNPLSKRKFHSLIPLKRNFTRDLFIGYQSGTPVHGLKTFYIDIKTTESVKKQTMLQRNMVDSKGK